MLRQLSEIADLVCSKLGIRCIEGIVFRSTERNDVYKFASMTVHMRCNAVIDEYTIYGFLHELAHHAANIRSKENMAVAAALVHQPHGPIFCNLLSDILLAYGQEFTEGAEYPEVIHCLYHYTKAQPLIKGIYRKHQFARAERLGRQARAGSRLRVGNYRLKADIIYKGRTVLPEGAVVRAISIGRSKVKWESSSVGPGWKSSLEWFTLNTEPVD